MPKQFIVVMEKAYPFGQLGEVLTEDTTTMVKKILKFTNEDQREIIKNMVHFLKVAKHDSLINLEKMLQGSDEVQLYYQYAPFKLEKWVATVNQDLLESLQQQMVELAQYLTRSSIKFTFNPQCLGLSKEMKIKYFLNQFSIDFEESEQHFKVLKAEISAFFKELGISTNSPLDPNQEEYVKEYPRLESVSTNASISPLDELITLTTQSLKKNDEKGTKNTQLSAKVQSSMKKSLQALLRFKKMNNPK